MALYNNYLQSTNHQGIIIIIIIIIIFIIIIIIIIIVIIILGDSLATKLIGFLFEFMDKTVNNINVVWNSHS